MCDRSYPNSRTRPQLASVAAAAAVTMFAIANASAGELSRRTSLGADLGGGSVITRYSPSAPDGGDILFTALRASYDVRDDASAFFSLRLWSLPGSNHATMPALGARYEPYRSDIGRAFVDAALGIAWTNDASNLAFDLGGGYEWDLPTVAGLSLGPVFRYGEVLDPAPRANTDGRSWQFGVSATFHLGRAEAGAKKEVAAGPVRPFVFKVGDADHDGVTDDVDQCPEVSGGRHPDPIRRGCPENDEDEDGITDSDDLCPLTPAGEKPDARRPGCPITDSDGDGIADADDRCPERAGVASEDPAKNGCPEPRKAKKKRKPAAPATDATLPTLTPTPKHGFTGSSRPN